MDTVHSPIATIPGIGDRMRAMVLAEIGDFFHFDSSPAYADMSPKSGQLSWSGTYSHMEKRGSRYLPYARYSATKYVCLWGPTFGAYLAQIRAVGKRYNVVLSRAAKKLLRLICTIEKFGQSYNSVAYKFSGCLNV